MDQNKGNLFIKRPKLAIVISLVIFFVGLLIIPTLPLEEYPSITPPQVIVTANYPGASSDVVENTIAAPVEAKLNGVEDMIYMSSTSQNGSYELTLYFDIGSDPDMAVINVQNQLQLVIPRLPEEVKKYGMSVKKSTGGPGLVMISITSPNKSYDSLFVANYADIFIKDELARIKGVGSVQVFGSSNYSMRVWLNSEKMANYGLSTQEVANAIYAQNIQSPAGELGVEPMKDKQLIKLILRTKGRLKNVDEFENIVLKSIPNGAQVKLKDVARVELGAESYSSVSRVNGENAAMVIISQLPEANSIDLANKVIKRMGELSKGFEKDIQYKIQHDETQFVRESINEVVHAVLLAILLVSLVTYLFLGSLRAAFIPFVAIPVSLIGVFIFMKFFGFSINLLILFGLVLAVGLVVDDAIVVLENTQRHIQEGKSVKEATEISMKEVFGAVLTTSLVLMAVFIPVSTMGGITGQMFRQFALCIASSIGLSTLVALTLSPALCSTILNSNTNLSDFKFIEQFDKWFEKLRDKYVETTEFFVNSKQSTVCVFGIVILLLVLMFYLIPLGFLPTEDKGALYTQVQLSDGATSYRTDVVCKDIESKISKIDGVKDIISLVGMDGENTAFIVTVLKPWKERKKASQSATKILMQINKEFSNYLPAKIASFSPPSISGLGMFGGFEYQLLDKAERSPEEMYDEANKLMNSIHSNPAFQMVYTSFTPNVPEVLLEVDNEKAMALGVNILDAYNTIAAYFAKLYVNDFNKFGRVYRVNIQADSEFREKISDLNKIYVKNNQGKMVPILSILKVQDSSGPLYRSRFNLYPAITINGSSHQGISSGKAMSLLEDISEKTLPKDMGYEWSGVSLQEKNSSGQVLPILILSLAFIFLFLVGLYESWFLPISVLAVTPLAIAGALILQYVFGYSLDIYSQVGLVMLIGLSTKQAILIIEFAKDAHENGMPAREAALQAAKLRFRAVMMTNIAFILGLLPLVFAKGAGAASRHSVGVTVLGGMIFVAFIGVLLVPAFYVIVEEFVLYLKSRIKNEK